MFDLATIRRMNEAATVEALWSAIDEEGGYFGDAISEVEYEYAADKTNELVSECPYEVRDFFEQDRTSGYDNSPWGQLEDYIRGWFFEGPLYEWPDEVLTKLEDEGRKCLAELRGVDPDDTLEGVDEEEEE